MADRKVPVWTGRDWIRTVILGWLWAAALCFAVLSPEEKDLSGTGSVGGACLPLFAAVFLTVTFGLRMLGRYRDLRKGSSLGVAAALALLLIPAAIRNPAPGFLAAAGTVLISAGIYAFFGRMDAPAPTMDPKRHGRCFRWATLGAGLVFFGFTAQWGLARVLNLATPSFDFGIFAQMFEKMRQTGLPLTTLERDGLLSHFAVHLSPIYYLLLPLYLVFPKPETLAVCQALVMASAAIPMWLLARRLRFSPAASCALCLVLLLHPAFSAGSAYDLHENVFLTPLLLWLFWAAERRSAMLTGLFALLTLCVKEDAAVYVGVFGLYLLLQSLLDRERRWELRAGLCLLAGALGWFLGAAALLRSRGEGVMDYRYANVMYPGSGSAVSVLPAMLLSPAKFLYECFETEKLPYVLQTMGPLLALPLLTRRYERMTLLIPWLLVNLLSDYSYQHDVLFQYSFGSLSFLLLAAALNLRDLTPLLRRIRLRWAPLALLLIACAAGFWTLDVKTAAVYRENLSICADQSRAVRERLEALPQDATVSASTYFTTALYDKAAVYDVSYESLEHLLNSDYVALEPRYTNLLKNWAEEGEPVEAGLTNLTNCLLSNGFRVIDQVDDRLILYRRGE